MTALRNTGFFALAFLSLGVAGYAIVMYGLLPLGTGVHPDMRASFEAQRIGIYTHVFGASLAMALGPFQFWRRLRTTRPHLHRWLGRIYLSSVLVGGFSGLFIAFHAFGGPVARVGFIGLALAWLYTGLQAYRAIRARDIATHQRWMIRNFALTFAAVTLRIWLPLSMVAGLPFEGSYIVIAWLCWVPNLLIAEFAWARRVPG